MTRRLEAATTTNLFRFNRFITSSLAGKMDSWRNEAWKLAATHGLKSDIVFWAEQLSEHALFMSLGLEGLLAVEAGKIHKDWENLRPKLTGANENEAVSLVKGPATTLRDFKGEVLTAMEKDWTGWLFPLFIDHTQRENQLLLDKIDGTVNEDDELKRWLQLMGEHAAFAAHLLDPSEDDLIERARTLKATLMNIPNVELDMMVTLSKRAGHELDTYFQGSGLGTPATKSVVHPKLAAHVVREGQRFLEFLNLTDLKK